jgi:hypothetical protein
MLIAALGIFVVLTASCTNNGSRLHSGLDAEEVHGLLASTFAGLSEKETILAAAQGLLDQNEHTLGVYQAQTEPTLLILTRSQGCRTGFIYPADSFILAHFGASGEFVRAERFPVSSEGVPRLRSPSYDPNPWHSELQTLVHNGQRVVYQRIPFPSELPADDTLPPRMH